MQTRRSKTFFLILSLLTFGCGSGDNLVTVEGNVTLDEKPLAGALVQFQPVDGSPSYGRTDENGDYDLSFSSTRKGAEIGEHKVSITTHRSGDADADPPVAARNEEVPDVFNARTTLKREVKNGSNTIDFELSTKKGKVSQPDESGSPKDPNDNCA